jgi:hypothetical protein
MKSQSIVSEIGLILSVSVMLTACAGGTQPPAPKTDLAVYEEVLTMLENLQPTNPIAVDLGATKAFYAPDEPLELRFAANADCYAALMRIQPDGTISFLLPNAQTPQVKLIKNVVYSTGRLPDSAAVENGILYDFGVPLTPSSQVGTDVYNLFCSATLLPFEGLNLLQMPEYSLTPKDTPQLQALLSSLQRLTGMEWSGTSVQVEVGAVMFQMKEVPEKQIKGAAPEIGPAPAPAGPMKARKFGAIKPIGATGTTGHQLFPPINGGATP